MTSLIDYKSPMIEPVLPILLQDHTTGENIIWATNSYADRGEGFQERDQITPELLLSDDGTLIQPRVYKALTDQQARTKSHAEVFTPSWTVNLMNNYCDEEWFGRPDVFNSQEDTQWKSVEGTIVFPEGKTWQDYIDSTRLEITCGEAPYIVSRYDAATGEIIPVKDRIGLLDRKLRVLSENTADSKDWYKWAVKALQSCYGYEFQGDSLLIGRINVLMSLEEHFYNRFKRHLTDNRIKELAGIISWNFWQMDGLTDCIPFDDPPEKKEPEMEYAFEAFGDFWGTEAEATEEKPPARECLIKDWKTNTKHTFHAMKEGKAYEAI